MEGGQINQVRVSNSLSHFKESFLNRWELKTYYNPNEPAIFFGLYLKEDWEVLKNHKSYALIVWGGNDQSIDAFKRVKQLCKNRLLGSPAYRPSMIEIFENIQYPFREMKLPLKDYSIFKPTKLGDKIYVYNGWKYSRNDYFKWESDIKPVIKEFGEERVIFTKNQKIEDLIENYYKKSFVFIKPEPKGGSTTMWEMGHMGIKTISKGQGNLPHVIDYKDKDHLIDLIKKEECKINTIQEGLANLVSKQLYSSSNWKLLDFWIKDI